MAAQAIKTMNLYSHLERFDNELRERSLPTEGPLDPAALSAIDSMHYYGTDAVDAAASSLGLDGSSRVLEIGSGLGGVARRIALTTNARVAALELQRDVSSVAAALTVRCGLCDYVNHVVGDIVAPGVLGKRTFTHVVSFLCFLHIPDKVDVLAAAYAALVPGGTLLVEDFYDNGLTDVDKAALEKDVFASGVPTRKAYLASLEAAGFKLHEWTDLTDSWATYTGDRAAKYAADEKRHVRVHGRATYDSQMHFYDVVARLFRGKRLGGVKYVASRPSS